MADGGPIRHTQLTIRCDGISSVTAATVTTTVSDTKAPQISGCTPAADSEMAPCAGVIQLHVTDGGSGVRYDGGTVTITIEGDLVYDGAHETSAGEYNTQSTNQAVKGICRRTGAAADYTFSFTPTTRFDYGQKVDVVVTVADVAGNTATVSYSFTTETRSFGENGKVNSDTGKVPHDHPHTAVDSAGNIWVVWDQQTAAGETDIYIGRLAAAGTAFGASTAVYQGAGVQSYPVIAIDRNNELYVAWQSQAANGNWDVCVSRSSDGTFWSTPVVVDAGDVKNQSSQMHPSIAADGLNPGTVYLAYEDNRAGNWAVWVATSTDGATWPETPIGNRAGDNTQPNMFIDKSSGTAIVLLTNVPEPSSHYSCIHVAASDNGWWTIPTLTDFDLNPRHALGVANFDTVLVWVEYNSTLCSGRVAGGQAYSYSAWAGAIWGTRAPVADEPGVTQAAPSLALNADRRVFAAWQDSRDARNNDAADIYFAEGTLTAAFGTNILVNDDTGGSAQSAPAVGADRNGSPYIVWVDERNGNKDIYYAGAVSISDPKPTIVVTTDNKVTVQAAAQANLQVEIPQMPSGTRADEITISEVSNPPQMPAGTNAVGLKYEFGPTGLQFPQGNPATIRIPVTQAGSYDSYRVYRYDPSDLTSPSFPWTESGIHNPATKVTGANGTYLEVQVDHFSIYGAAGITVPPPPGGGGGGGGGGCALSPYGGCGPVEFMLPFIVYALVLFGMTLARKRRHCK